MRIKSAGTARGASPRSLSEFRRFSGRYSTFSVDRMTTGHALLEARIQRYPRYTTNRVTPTIQGVSPIFRAKLADANLQPNVSTADWARNYIRQVFKGSERAAPS